jgi:Uma2 family endonuclease
MSTVEAPILMTTEEFLALPENGVRRELIFGQLREEPMTYRNRRHSKLEAAITELLRVWLKTQPAPAGEVLVGEVGFRIQDNPDTVVGIDVAYMSADLAAKTPEDARPIDGVPVLAVEILSPSDTQENNTDKIRAYLDAKVPLDWLVETDFRTITVYRPDALPRLYNLDHTITGETHLPGFSAALTEIFETMK